jgi:hypothetical protein
MGLPSQNLRTPNEGKSQPPAGTALQHLQQSDSQEVTPQQLSRYIERADALLNDKEAGSPNVRLDTITALRPPRCSAWLAIDGRNDESSRSIIDTSPLKITPAKMENKSALQPPAAPSRRKAISLDGGLGIAPRIDVGTAAAASKTKPCSTTPELERYLHIEETKCSAVAAKGIVKEDLPIPGPPFLYMRVYKDLHLPKASLLLNVPSWGPLLVRCCLLYNLEIEHIGRPKRIFRRINVFSPKSTATPLVDV